MKFATVCAVAALAATALLFAAPHHALAYCRGCVVEPLRSDVPPAATLARAEAVPEPPKSECHIEKQLQVRSGQARVRRVEICE